MSFRTQLEITTMLVIVNLQYKLANRIAQLAGIKTIQIARYI